MVEYLFTSRPRVCTRDLGVGPVEPPREHVHANRLGYVAGERLPRGLLQDQEVARLHEDPLPRVLGTAVQVHADRDLPAVGRLTDHGHQAWRRGTDARGGDVTDEVVEVHAAVKQRAAG